MFIINFGILKNSFKFKMCHHRDFKRSLVENEKVGNYVRALMKSASAAFWSAGLWDKTGSNHFCDI